MEELTRNCRFLSIVVVERVLRITFRKMQLRNFKCQKRALKLFGHVSDRFFGS